MGEGYEAGRARKLGRRGKEKGRGEKVRTDLYPPLTKTFRRACFATIWFTCDKISYVKIRAYDSKNIIRMIRMLKL